MQRIAHIMCKLRMAGRLLYFRQRRVAPDRQRLASTGQIPDSQAFLDVGAGKWTCALASGANCTAMSTNVTGQNQAALGSDNVTINVDTT